jgi:D-xylose transport system permease protein
VNAAAGASAAPEVAADQQGVAAVLRRRLDALRQGEVGSLPIVIGLIIITIFFTTKTTNFVSATNFNNLVVQMAGVTTIAIGVVFVLLLGEIDLSIGYLSGIAGVIVAELQLAGSGHQVPGLVAILLALVAGAVIGGFMGSFVAFLGVPSFVVTLAANLAFQGVILRALPQGVIVIQDNMINNVANYFFSHLAGFVIAGVASAIYVVAVLGRVIARWRAGLTLENPFVTLGKTVAFPAIAFGVVVYSNHDPGRGLPFAGLLVVAMLVFWTYVATRTTFGRHVYAVGGNAEAARRSGINVVRIRLIVFMISGAMAALGGVIFAARLRSVDLSAGGGTILLDAIAAAVIGGTSLFGGRGAVKSALLGALIIAMLANGIDLVGYPASTKYIVTGVILLAAVTLDTISRRRLERSGR